MSYNSSIPNVTDFLAISQKQLLANFQSINSAFNQNHVNLNTINDIQGEHSSLTLRVQGGDPATAVDQVALYNKLDAFSVPQLFFRPSSNQTPIQMTNSSVSQTALPTTFRQSSFVAGPFTMYMGFLLNPANNTLVTLLPASTLLYVGLASFFEGTANGNTAAPVSISTNTFVIKYRAIITTPPTVVYYFAIGNS